MHIDTSQLETSNAARQGVKVGDCIVAIGERIVTGTRLYEFKKIIGSGGPRPSPLLIRFLPQNEAIDVLKTYVKDGVAGLMEFRMAILRDKKRSSLMRAGVKTMQNSIKSEHLAEHNGDSADHSTGKSLLKSRSKWKSLIKKQRKLQKIRICRTS